MSRPYSPAFDDLPNELSMSLLGHPFDDKSAAQERFLIEFLSEQLDGWEEAENSLPNLLATFDKYDTGSFDIREFILRKVKEGHYVMPEEWTQEQE